MICAFRPSASEDLNMSDQPTLQAVIFDWAGTILDHGSRAPMGAFVKAFAAFGVNITIADARGPMGMAKRDHIRAVGQAPAVAAAWEQKHGHPFGEADIDALFETFEPMNIAAVHDHMDFIPGALETVAKLKEAGLRIGSTTGYTRPIMEEIMPIAAARGYAPEITVCAGDLAAGRPSPLMMWHAMAQMGIWPAHTVVKVDDTLPGIGEGVAAGTWTVGVTLSGNMVGLSAEERAALSEAERNKLREQAAADMRAAGADIVIDSVADLPAAIEQIEAALKAGKRPGGN
jgi:phosphonoacetaldehyde hydrolase